MIRPWITLASKIDHKNKINLFFTFANGQCFSWKLIHPQQNIWVGVVKGYVTQLRETDTGKVEFRCINKTWDDTNVDDLKSQLHDYFQLQVDMNTLFTEWSNANASTKSICSSLTGMRILRQDPVECLFSFVCSSNNNIARIEQMVNKLRESFGQKIETTTDEIYYAFPTIQSLANASEQELRDLGFGYRAKFVVKTAGFLNEQPCGGLKWLNDLRNSKDRMYVQSQLLQLCGVGRKVADCCALFSLDQVDCIPVDTHVFEIAKRDYDHTLQKVKSITPSIYEQIGNVFRNAFGSHAGWAHSILFAAELPKFHSFLSDEMQVLKLKEKQEKHEQQKRAAKKRKQGKDVKGKKENAEEKALKKRKQGKDVKGKKENAEEKAPEKRKQGKDVKGKKENAEEKAPKKRMQQGNIAAEKQKKREHASSLISNEMVSTKIKTKIETIEPTSVPKASDALILKDKDIISEKDSCRNSSSKSTSQQSKRRTRKSVK